MNFSEFDVFSTKQSNYFPCEDFSSDFPFEKPQKSFFSVPQKSVFSFQKEQSISKRPFKDEIKVQFFQQPKTKGDNTLIDPITNRPFTLRKPLEFERNYQGKDLEEKETGKFEENEESNRNFEEKYSQKNKENFIEKSNQNFNQNFIEKIKENFEENFYEKPSQNFIEKIKENFDENFNEKNGKFNEKNTRFIPKSEKSLLFEFNSIDFSKPFPLIASQNSLERNLVDEIKLNKPTELEYTNSKDPISFSVSPLTTNLSDRAQKDEKTEEIRNKNQENPSVFMKNSETFYSEKTQESERRESRESEVIERGLCEENSIKKSSFMNNDNDFIRNFKKKDENFMKKDESFMKKDDFIIKDDIFMKNNEIFMEKDLKKKDDIFMKKDQDFYNFMQKASNLSQKENSYFPNKENISPSDNCDNFHTTETEDFLYNDKNNDFQTDFSPKFINKSLLTENSGNEIENIITSSNKKREKDLHFLPKKLNFEDCDEQEQEFFLTKDLILAEKTVLHRKKKEKQFSFAENVKNSKSFFIQKNDSFSENEKIEDFKPKSPEKSFQNVYEHILNRIFNEKTSQEKISQKTNPLISEKNSKKALNKSAFLKPKTEKKLNRKEMSSYIEKIMFDAHKFKENKENSQNFMIPNDKKQRKNSIQNTIIITNNHNCCRNHEKIENNVFQLDLSEIPTLIPLKNKEKNAKTLKNHKNTIGKTTYLEGKTNEFNGKTHEFSSGISSKGMNFSDKSQKFSGKVLQKQESSGKIADKVLKPRRLSYFIN